MEFSEPWATIDSTVRGALENELRLELPEGHVLAGQQVRAVAGRHDRDDVLLSLPENRWAIVHLTWKSVRERDPHWPTTELLRSDQELAARLRADSSEFE